MDFVTHALIGAGIAHLAAPVRRWIPQLALAGVLGSMLMDNDSWLYLLGPNMYGRYHRIITHSLPGLALSALAAVAIAVATAHYRPQWRRFGWFVAENLEQAPPDRPPVVLFLLVASLAAAAHFCADVITGFGNMQLFWPWSSRDFSLALVNSFVTLLFGSTLAWHVALRQTAARWKMWALTGAWLAVVLVYLLFRWWFGWRGIW